MYYFQPNHTIRLKKIYGYLKTPLHQFSESLILVYCAQCGYDVFKWVHVTFWYFLMCRIVQQIRNQNCNSKIIKKKSVNLSGITKGRFIEFHSNRVVIRVNNKKNIIHQQHLQQRQQTAKCIFLKLYLQGYILIKESHS